MLPGGLRWRRSGRMDLRNHRKIAVIDNEVAYVGSQNLAGPGFVPGHPNRELVARVRGPAVAHLEAVFASDCCCPAARPTRTATRVMRWQR
ncbi:hypothetical protein G6F64_015086 [Rhizopus arrhizus]|uniref:PLD phosphodiesterase domain-containing protein n=1 Tax=Rhizopus oryzae TaxID=64495 RepID=A0A9P6WS75_RHIOR|nr:hypothetical protein G6F64_015086 [Rhizopus arrhizus]